MSPYRQVFDFVKFNGAPCTYTITPNGATNYVGFTDPEWKIVLGTLNQNWVITLVDGSNNLYTWAPLACTVILFLTWPSLSIQPSGSSQGWTNPGAGNQVKVVQTISSAIIHTLFQIYLSASYSNWQITKKWVFRKWSCVRVSEMYDYLSRVNMLSFLLEHLKGSGRHY